MKRLMTRKEKEIVKLLVIEVVKWIVLAVVLVIAAWVLWLVTPGR